VPTRGILQSLSLARRRNHLGEVEMERKKKIPAHFLEANFVIDSLIQNKTTEEGEWINLLIALRKEGCNIGIILYAVFSVEEKWKEKTGLSDLQVDYSTVFPKRNEHNARKRIIGNAIRNLSELAPLPTGGALQKYSYSEINKNLFQMQESIKAFSQISDKYLDALYVQKLDSQSIDDFFAELSKAFFLKKNPNIHKKFYKKGKKGKVTQKVKLTQSTHGMWGKPIVDIVDELRRINHTQIEAFKKTAEILKTFYPDIYIDTDPDLVRQTYMYHQGK
jgi:hypothetical protein